MIFFYAGLRVSDMKALGKFPTHLLWTFDDVSPDHGGGEQRGLWRRAYAARKGAVPAPGAAPSVPAPIPRPGVKESRKSGEGRLIIFFSGEENKAVPEVILKDAANIMLTYMEIKGATPRWRRIVKSREKR